MGEIADMILEGILCEGCGVTLSGKGNGYPRKCWDCRRAEDQPLPLERVACKICKRRVKFVGLKDHMRDTHGEKKS